MEKEFVPYDLALELKELGFDETCFGSIDQIGYIHVKGSKSSPRGSMLYNTINCPTFSQALKLGEVKSAYIALKRADKVFQEDVKKIKAFLEPPKPEPTEEELKEQRLKFYSEEYKRLQRDGKVLGTTIFYDLIKKEGLETVKLKWLEAILDKFKPETVDKSMINEPQLVKLPKIKKHDAKTFFIDELVHAYFVNKKIKELSEEDFINHWENIFR